MSLPTVQDPLITFPGTATVELVYSDEMALQANGQTRVQDVAPELWMLKAASHYLRPSLFREWKARLSALENGLKPFWGRDCSATFPLLYPNGTWPTGVSFNGQTAQINSVGGDNKSLSLKLVPTGYVVSAGDQIAFLFPSGTNYALHQAVETVGPAVAGVTPVFEVRPHFAAGSAIVNTVVRVKNPLTQMIMTAGSLMCSPDERLGGMISFTGSQIF